jgi:hypothetical protein
MEAWAKSAGADGKISFLADGNGDFARALGLSLDLTARGLGIRSQRYAMIVDNGRNVKRGNPAEATLDPLALTAGYGAPSPLRRVLRDATMLLRRMRRATNPLQQIGRRWRFPYS